MNTKLFVPVHFALTLAATACMGVAANATILTPTEIVVIDLTDSIRAPLGTDVPAQFQVRETGGGAQFTPAAAFLNFDVSSLTLSDVTTPGFSASFEVEFAGALNTNAASVVLGVVGIDAFNGTDNLPAFSDALTRTTNGVGDVTGLALPPVDLIADVSSADAVAGQVVSVDITSVIQGYVDGTLANFGLVLFIDETNPQSAGFNAPQIVTAITVVPEPASVALLGLGAVMVLARRRNA